MDKFVVKEKGKKSKIGSLYICKRSRKKLGTQECINGVIFQLNFVSLTFRKDTVAFPILDPQKKRKA